MSSEQRTRDAEAALAKGRTAFTYRLTSTSSRRMGPVPDWSDQIEAIESVGWRLDQFSTIRQSWIGAYAAVCVFRRA